MAEKTFSDPAREPKILALVREPFDMYVKGDKITSSDDLKSIKAGPHSGHILMLNPHTSR